LGGAAADTALSVGNDATITAVVNGAVDATAVTTTGNVIADADTTLLAGVQADSVVVGDNGVVQATSALTSDVSATTVNGTSTATNDVVQATGLDLEALTVGNNAQLNGSFGILGRTDVDLTTAAISSGADAAADKTSADGQISTATGIQLGGAAADTALSVGNSSTIAGIADITSASSATRWTAKPMRWPWWVTTPL